MSVVMVYVLDKGYVRLCDTNLVRSVMGSDLSVVNAARASFAKENFELSERDIRLIRFLAEHGHESPFRHAVVTLEIKAPLMVARQWFKYRIGAIYGPDTAEFLGVSIPADLYPHVVEYLEKVIGWVPQGDDAGFDDRLYARNEASRRYLTTKIEFYVPTVWRRRPENAKQGSAGPLPEDVCRRLTERLEQKIRQGIEDFEWALSMGVAPEQARGFLDCMYFLYTSWRWTASLQAVAHFLQQRLGDDAQWEIQQYARGVFELIRPLFPHSIDNLVHTNNDKKESTRTVEVSAV